MQNHDVSIDVVFVDALSLASIARIDKQLDQFRELPEVKSLGSSQGKANSTAGSWQRSTRRIETLRHGAYKRSHRAR
jgi:hypothetical protein